MRPRIIALAKVRSDGKIELRAPSVGLWREGPTSGSLLGPGMKMGAIEILGAVSDLIVPEDAVGIAIESVETHLARRPIGHGEVLVVLDPNAAGPSARAEAAQHQTRSQALMFLSPMGGRFYLRPSPDKPPFVTAGQELGPGQTIGLLEVMKTFNRITYGGGGHPERARVVRVVPADGADLAAGDPILEIAPI